MEVINILEKKFASIVANPRLIGELCEIMGDMPNIDAPTMGGKVFWNTLAESNGWKLQQNKLTKHCRILDFSDIRKALGSKSAMKKAMNPILTKQEEKKGHSGSRDSEYESKEEVLKALEKLGELKKDIITEEEFRKKKEKLLAQI